MGDNVRHNYTLACIQYKLQKKEDAMIVCKHTIYLAKMAGVESKTADLLLEKIEALKSTE
ncbi:MAG: hypothetical protein IPO63_09170 [Bacteroidetes bacterium]|nr:hypothetical protein [Bacteroidota bacterium]